MDRRPDRHVSTNSSLTSSSLFPSALDTAGRQTLINWVRGTANVVDDSYDRGPGGDVTVRPSIHGDVLHSRPVWLVA